MALNGKLQGMDVEEGNEKQSKLLEAFSAFVMEDEEDAMPEENFLFTPVSYEDLCGFLRSETNGFLC